MGCAACSSVKPAVESEYEAFAENFVAICTARNFHHEYMLHERLGKGAFAVVYSAAGVVDDGGASVIEDKNCRVAVKVIDMRQAWCKVSGFDHPGIELNPVRRVGLYKEVDVLNRVRGHKNCCRILDAFVNAGLGYIVIEQYDTSLGQALDRKGVLNEETIRPYFRDMLAGLSHLHAQSVVHRDVKPDNFLCSGPRDTVKLCDFGLAGVMSEPGACECSGIHGTAPYMAPEIVKSWAHGNKADAWSFGVIVYVLFFGRYPYMPEDRSTASVKAAILADQPPPRFRADATARSAEERLSTEAMQLVKMLLRRDVLDRLSCTTALGHPFFSSTSLSQRSLRPMLLEAKRWRCIKIRGSERGNQGDVDSRLLHLQEKHHPAMATTSLKVRAVASDTSTDVGSLVHSRPSLDATTTRQFRSES